jgi:hypothetical protein
MEGVRKQGLHEKAHILASVLPIKSVETARRMRSGVGSVDNNFIDN